MNLEDRVNRLPEELVREIYDFIYPNKFQLLLSLYPKEVLAKIMKTFTWEQLDRVYRHGCVSKIFRWDPNSGYESWNVKLDVKSLFPIIRYENVQYYDSSVNVFCHNHSPISNFNSYWTSNDKKYKVYRPEYIRRINRFYSSLIDPPPLLESQKRNTKLAEFSEKTVHDLILGILIIHNSNTKKHQKR